MNHDRTLELRDFLRDTIRLQTDFSTTDQALGKPMPPVQKPPQPDQIKIDLPDPAEVSLQTSDLRQLIAQRRSVRQFSERALTPADLSWLLWATQGVRRQSPERVLRTVPSAGNRHSFETYLCVLNVTGLEPGIYRYLPLDHALVLEYRADQYAQPLPDLLAEAALGQYFTAKAPVTFIWTALPYRTEWRYSQGSVKVIALDAGHVMQNLYLASEAIGCGTCAIAAYHQYHADQLLHVDGQDEFVIYMAPVGGTS